MERSSRPRPSCWDMVLPSRGREASFPERNLPFLAPSDVRSTGSGFYSQSKLRRWQWVIWVLSVGATFVSSLSTTLAVACPCLSGQEASLVGVPQYGTSDL